MRHRIGSTGFKFASPLFFRVYYRKAYYSTSGTPRTGSTMLHVYHVQHMQQAALDSHFVLV
jgi:hypothetical protein